MADSRQVAWLSHQEVEKNTEHVTREANRVTLQYQTWKSIRVRKSYVFSLALFGTEFGHSPYNFSITKLAQNYCVWAKIQ